MTISRELVRQTLEFKCPKRVARQMWILPWAHIYESESVKKIVADFPDDIIWDMPVPYKTPPQKTGNLYEIGTYIDEWGCEFTSIRRGYVGEVKKPLVLRENWEDADNIRIPVEMLDIDINAVNAYCAGTDKFVVQTDMIRVFERLQFIRGTSELFIDIAEENEGMREFIKKLHDFNCRAVEVWCKTNIDAVLLMDDWGSQNSLLIDPKTWVSMFKPLYAEYCQIAKKHGKKVFMHSDGCTLQIIPHLIEIGVDAANLQLSCIGVENLAPYKGKLTFWGEICRQHILPNASLDRVQQVVQNIFETLWDNGGCIAQCEFGPGAKPENVYKVFDVWSKLLN